MRNIQTNKKCPAFVQTQSGENLQNSTFAGGDRGSS